MNAMRNIRIILVVAICWLNITACFSQQSTGFYFAIEDRRNCSNIIYSFDEKQKYCVTKEPILSDREFESISEIEFDPLRQSKCVNLQLTKKGFDLIQKLTKQLPNKKLLLVVGNRVVGTFNGVGKIASRRLPISGSMDSQVVDWVHDKLSKNQR
jgi:preprotein translocase subunit SecD